MHQDPNSETRDPLAAPSGDLPTPSSQLGFDGFGAPRGPRPSDPRVSMANGARYKAMSPARLPIARSPCITIPPGFSPTALLESPVLLTNIKAEPSPTTGTFSMHSILNDNMGTLSSPRGAPQTGPYNQGSSGDFEFKPHTRTSSCSGLSSLGPLASVGPKQQEHQPSRQIWSQSEAQMLESSQLVKAVNTANSSHELTLAVTAPDVPIEAFSLKATAPGEVACDDSQQTQGSDNAIQAVNPENNGSAPLTVVEKSSEDGYNWRKYGQKHVKGSEFPRSYYKCTHPNCQMKKQLERSHDGQVTEIIYKGRHDHPKPQPSRRLAVGAIFSGHGDDKFDGLSSSQGAEEKSSNTHRVDPNGTADLSPISASDDDVEVGGGQSNHNENEAADDEDPESKRRKMDAANFDASSIGKPNREPRVVVQTVSEVDILDDGYRWRKYGQKVVKGNPNPRSYYKCTSVGCSVRKHVERASHDPKAVITTYEGKHNHDVPAARTSGHDTMVSNSHIPVPLSVGMLRTSSDTLPTSCHYARPEETDTISLDLGVGISPNHSSSTSNEKQQQASGSELLRSHEMQQFNGSDCNKVLIQSTPVSNIYGSSSNGIHGPRGENEGFSFRPPSINHSSGRYYVDAGNLVMGP